MRLQLPGIMYELGRLHTDFWDRAPCSLVDVGRCFRGTYCLRRYIPEGFTIHTRSRENLKSHNVHGLLIFKACVGRQYGPLWRAAWKTYTAVDYEVYVHEFTRICENEVNNFVLLEFS
jgi:hypothetical protein